MVNGGDRVASPDPARPLGPLPIVVGVTGHRDLRPEDVPQLEAAVAGAFDRLRDQCPSTPLLVLSALAAGADRLVARVAMDRGIRVVVPLPLERLEYERDFDAEEREEFDLLLARAAAMLPKARSSYFVGYVPANGDVAANDASNVREPARRAMQYAQVGAYIARNSQILLALWNGIGSSAIGGTAQVVTFKREGRAPGFGPEPQPLDLPEYGPVWQIVTPRASEPGQLSGGAAFELVEMLPAPRPIVPSAEPTTRHALLTRVLHLLRKRELNDAEVTAKMRKGVDRFNRSAVSAGFDAATLSTKTVLKAAETIAKRYQIWTLRTLRWLYLAGFLATVAFVMYAHVWHDRAEYLYFDVIVSIIALGVFASAENREWQNSHQDYRAVAEGLRVQEQWHKANLRETVAEHYLRQHRGELDWIRNAIRTCRLVDDTAAVDDDAVDIGVRRDCLRTIYHSWIAGPEGQITYFTERSDTEELVEIGFALVTWTTVILSIVATALVGIAFGALGVALEQDGHERPAWTLVIVFIALAAVLSGLVASYAQKRAHGIHVKRYRRMRTIFAQAGLLLHDILEKPAFDENDYAAAQLIIRELGKEALLENAAWVMLHRERPLEFIQGG